MEDQYKTDEAGSDAYSWFSISVILFIAILAKIIAIMCCRYLLSKREVEDNFPQQDDVRQSSQKDFGEDSQDNEKVDTDRKEPPLSLVFDNQSEIYNEVPVYSLG